MPEQGKIINIGDVRSEDTWREQPLTERLHMDLAPINAARELLEEVKQTRKLVDLAEAFVASPDANNMLRDGIRFLANRYYDSVTPTFAPIATVVQSTRPEEQYIRDATLGTMPEAPSGTNLKYALSSLEGGVTIRNKRYAIGVQITMDDIRFDRLGKIAQIAPELGRAARYTEEDLVWRTITTTGNYTRNSTTGDNDVGANTGTTTFNAVNLETAIATITTAKDRKGGVHLNLVPDTIICSPRMEWAIRLLLLSPDLMRVGGNTTNEVRGTGTMNPYRGSFRRIIVTPKFPTYHWALVDSTIMSFVFQQVEPVQVISQTRNPDNTAYFERDSMAYRASTYFGQGFVDDRAWYFSNSTTAPTVG